MISRIRFGLLLQSAQWAAPIGWMDAHDMAVSWVGIGGMQHKAGALRLLPAMGRYAAALGLFAITVTLQALVPALPADSAYLLLLAITVLAFYRYGQGPGWLTVILGGAAGLGLIWLPGTHPFRQAPVGAAAPWVYLFAAALTARGLAHLQRTVRALHDSTVQLRQANAAAAAAERRLRAILDDQTEFISRTTPDGTVLYVNDTYCRMFGVDARAIVGARAPVTTYLDDRAKVERQLATIMPSIRCHHREPRVHLRPRPALVPVRAPRLVHGARPAQRNPECRSRHLGTAPGRGTAGRKRGAFSFVLRGNSCVLLMIDLATRRIVDANVAAARFYGYPLETLIGMPVNRINTLGDEALGEELARAERDGRTHFHSRTGWPPARCARWRPIRRASASRGAATSCPSCTT